MLNQLEKQALEKVQQILNLGGDFEDSIESNTEIQEIYYLDKATGEMNDLPTKRIVTTKERRVSTKKSVPDYILKFFLNMQQIETAMQILNREGYEVSIDERNRETLKNLQASIKEILNDKSEKVPQDLYQDKIARIQRDILGLRSN